MKPIRTLKVNSNAVLVGLTLLLSGACTPPDSVWIPGFSGLMAVAGELGKRASVIGCMTLPEDELYGPGR